VGEAEGVSHPGRVLAERFQEGFGQWCARRRRLLALSRSEKRGKPRPAREKADLRLQAESFSGWGKRIGGAFIPVFSLGTEKAGVEGAEELSVILGDLLVSKLQGVQKTGSLWGEGKNRLEGIRGKVGVLANHLSAWGQKEVDLVSQFLDIRRGFAPGGDWEEAGERLDLFIENNEEFVGEGTLLADLLGMVSARYPDPDRVGQSSSFLRGGQVRR